MSGNVISRYGVNKQNESGTVVDQAVEAIYLAGYAVVKSNYGADELNKLSDVFDRAVVESQRRYGGRDALAKIDEHNTIRAPLAIDPLFLNLAHHPTVLAICRCLIGDYVILNQQNGIINPPNAQRYNQAVFHRDLPYQHFVSSRPLAVNALFCLEPFTIQNGATCVIPASHKEEAFPSAATVEALQIQVSADAGSFIILDAMLFHSGGVNRTEIPRRAVSHLYTVPIIRQQIDLPALLGPDFTPDPEIRRLLGYDVQTPPDVFTYYKTRQAKKIGN